jgi:tetratricopeptide (TPR) repeat protein
VKTLLLFIACTVVSVTRAAEPAASGAAEQKPLVILFSRSITGTTCGNGFVIGDGTLIVTARHVIYPERLGGMHQGDAFITVLSPYLGDACEADVVAQDRALDLAVVRVSGWEGHPAAQLAEEADVAAAETVWLVGWADAVAAVTAGKPALLEGALTTQSCEITVHSVNVRRSVMQSVLSESPPAGAGWAGAPMVLGGDGKVAGCYARTQSAGAAGFGAAVGIIRELIARAGDSTALNRPATKTLSAADASAATGRYLRGVAASAAGDGAGALEQFQAFVQLRPACAIGYRDAAGQAWTTERLDDAQHLYARALEIDPSSVSARVLYGQLLHQRHMPVHALEHLRYAWEHGRVSSRSAALIPLCNLLREQGKDEECAQLLAEALKQNPADGFLWNYLGQSRAAMKDHRGAADALARSAELMPENEPARLQAAQEYVLADDLSKAEAQFRAAAGEHPDSSWAHYFLAKFLARDSARREEALREAEQALTLADRPGAVPRAQVQALIPAIRSGRASAGGDFRL